MEACVRKSDGVIVQTGSGLATDPAWDLVELTDEQAKDYLAKAETAAGAGVKFAKGVLTANPAPTVAAPVASLADQVADLTTRLDALSSGLATAKDLAAVQAAASAAV